MLHRNHSPISQVNKTKKRVYRCASNVNPKLSNRLPGGAAESESNPRDRNTL